MQPKFPSSLLCLALAFLGLLPGLAIAAPSPAHASGHAHADGGSANSTAPGTNWSATSPGAENSTARDNSTAPPAYGSTPAFVVYTDIVTGGSVLPPVSEIEGYTVVVLSFLLASGAADQAAAWAALSAPQKAALKAEYNAAGVSVLVSAFGATDAPTSGGADPVATANAMAQWVLDNQLDGIDVDYEDLDAMNARDGGAEAWLVVFTQTLREKLPKGDYLLTHAPVAPWFSPAFDTTGAYLTVHEQAGDLIDWYNVQFYNQGPSTYTTCTTLLRTAGAPWPGSALREIAHAGVPLAKLVIGKYAAPGGGADGFMDPEMLAGCVGEARRELGWGAGIMTWEYPDANSTWIKAARGTAFPL
ncbi:glycoside hydrolase [Lenzites betulinus]|nr:glycoside hydrolase [Lenzites betulinus]